MTQTQASPRSADDVMEAMRDVVGPELGINVVDLGLVYGVTLDADGTAVIDMRYENPFYMAEDAGAADIIAGGRLQLGISRGSPEQVMVMREKVSPSSSARL